MTSSKDESYMHDDDLPFFSDERAYRDAIKKYENGEGDWPNTNHFNLKRNKKKRSGYDPTGRLNKLARWWLG